MKTEFIGDIPILTPAQLEEILFGTSTTNKKDPIEEARDKFINEGKQKDTIGKQKSKPICFDIQSITANHKKNAFTVVWADGSHTIIHLQPREVWDNEKALAMCFVKHMMGDKSSFNDIFTKDMPAKIKHIGNIEPVEEKPECKCDTPCQDCSCHTEAEKAAEVSVGAADKKVQRYDLFLISLSDDKTEIYHQGTDEEIHKAMRAYRMKHYPILEWNNTPYRTWQKDGSLFVDFGASSYFMVPGMDHETFIKGN